MRPLINDGCCDVGEASRYLVVSLNLEGGRLNCYGRELGFIGFDFDVGLGVEEVLFVAQGGAS